MAYLPKHGHRKAFKDRKHILSVSIRGDLWLHVPNTVRGASSKYIEEAIELKIKHDKEVRDVLS